MRIYYIFITVLTVLICSLIVVVISMLGSPALAKKVARDTTRINHLSYIARDINRHYDTTRELPKDINILGLEAAYSDPLTKEKYEYIPKDAVTYTLCAVFEATDSEYRQVNGTVYYYPSTTNEHKKGRSCFDYIVNSDEMLPVPVVPIPGVGSASASLKAVSSSLTESRAEFNFDHSLSQGHNYVVDVSIDPDFKQRVYFRFAESSESPAVNESPQVYTEYTCGTKIYWRVGMNNIYTPSQHGTVVCDGSNEPSQLKTAF